MVSFNDPTTRLLTLLNVSSVKANKRKQPHEVDEAPSREKLNKRTKSAEAVSTTQELLEVVEGDTTNDPVEDGASDDGDDDTDDPYESHFGVKPRCLTATARSAVERSAWISERIIGDKLGAVTISCPESVELPSSLGKRTGILERLHKPFTERQKTHSPEKQQLQNNIISSLSSGRDLFLSRATPDTHPETREAIALHLLNHITKKRRRVLKNNERLSHHTKTHPNDPPPEDVQDQGFTRPSVLVLVPFRNSALSWMRAVTSHTPAPEFQVEHRARFEREFGLPEGTVDKLASVEPGTYPADHIATFSGNVDDSFRIGIKMTRKSVKLFAEFYGCDFIIASPLGLRMSIEKDKNADFLSSIELLVIDQMDALTMQNWDHVQFVLSQLNQMPKESHDTDFSRVKPWYLDGYAPYLRQTIMVSAYETPEIRHVFNSTLKNVAGKMKTDRQWQPLAVPDGVEQRFIQFDCASAKDEADKRFDYFTTQILPTVLKSAVQSTNTVVFVPSSFDFIRVQNYFRKHAGVSFTALSEYSSNQDISRARLAFFNGSKAFLLISERFHFFRRYKIRGIRNLLFYGPPDHPQFYSEFLSYPFLDDGVESSDVTCRVLYTRFDWFRLERIAGTEAAAELVKRSM